MVKRKSAPVVSTALAVVPAKPVAINAGQVYDPKNPYTWLVLIGDPRGTVGAVAASTNV